MYIAKFKKLIRTHDLVLLGRRLSLSVELLDKCKEVSPAYTYTRYPDVAPVKDIEDRADQFIKYAEEVLEWAESQL